ncbi:MAG: phenylalanine--tRNA ligase subunit alpha, partial [Thermomicrobiales bacterium]
MAQEHHGLATEIERIQRHASAALDQLTDAAAAEEWERDWLGPKGQVSLLLRGLGGLPKEERPIAGRAAQTLRANLETRFNPIKERLSSAALDEKLLAESVDITLPGRQSATGFSHPVSDMIDELIEIFAHLGFQAVFGPEVETGHYNFDLLNIPKDHPARDVWDTIIVDSPNEDIVLRTHTSPMQARTMERLQPPVRVIVPGRVFRFEAQDASHEWQFTQLEGLAVDEHLTMADLKGVLQEVARQL